MSCSWREQIEPDALSSPHSWLFWGTWWLGQPKTSGPVVGTQLVSGSHHPSSSQEDGSEAAPFLRGIQHRDNRNCKESSGPLCKPVNRQCCPGQAQPPTLHSALQGPGGQASPSCCNPSRTARPPEPKSPPPPLRILKGSLVWKGSSFRAPPSVPSKHQAQPVTPLPRSHLKAFVHVVLPP